MKADTDWSTQPIADAATAQRMFSAMLQRAQHAGVQLRPPPAEPVGCCGRGCNGCVWESYYGAVAYWRDEALLLLD